MHIFLIPRWCHCWMYCSSRRWSNKTISLACHWSYLTLKFSDLSAQLLVFFLKCIYTIWFLFNHFSEDRRYCLYFFSRPLWIRILYSLEHFLHYTLDDFYLLSLNDKLTLFSFLWLLKQLNMRNIITLTIAISAWRKLRRVVIVRKLGLWRW
jgi:hypothetical protein